MRCLLGFTGAFLLAQGILRLAFSQPLAGLSALAAGAVLLAAAGMARSSSLPESLAGYLLGVLVTLATIALYPMQMG